MPQLIIFFYIITSKYAILGCSLNSTTFTTQFGNQESFLNRTILSVIFDAPKLKKQKKKSDLKKKEKEKKLVLFATIWELTLASWRELNFFLKTKGSNMKKMVAYYISYTAAQIIWEIKNRFGFYYKPDIKYSWNKLIWKLSRL